MCRRSDLCHAIDIVTCRISHMLIDWHRNCLAVSVAGYSPLFRVGEQLMWSRFAENGIGAGIEKNLSAEHPIPQAIPIDGETWLLFPQCYRSSGCLWLLRLPFRGAICHALCRQGDMICVRDDDREEIEQALEMWQAVNACLPRSDFEGEVLDEMIRLLGAISSFFCLELTLLPVGTHTTLQQEDAPVAPTDQDLSMFVTMLLCLLGQDLRREARRMIARFFRMREGYVLGLATHLKADSAEIETCRAMAEVRHQFFSCEHRDGMTFVQICPAMKDPGFIGLKSPHKLFGDLPMDGEWRTT